MFYNGGFKIYSTMNIEVQSAMEEVYKKESRYFYETRRNDEGERERVQSAMTIMDYSGHIVGVVGGTGEKTVNRGLNRALVPRQPGSTMKPLGVYAQAIENDIVDYTSTVLDKPVKNYYSYGKWGPREWFGEYLGKVPLNYALRRSMNAVPVRLLDKVGIDESYKFLTKKLNFKHLVKEDKNASSLALGGCTYGITPTESAAAFAIFGNGGMYYKPTTYYKIVDIDGNVILEEDKKGKHYGLLDLDPAPHFDLVIIDEAHHIRNGSLDKEKAFAYKCVRYFCEHADAVVMLTATPLQTKDDDLFTLLNLLRPDVVMDKDTFTIMSRPNEYIYQCSHAIRGAAEGWQQRAIEALHNISATQWGENVICRNPLYADVILRLGAEEISREERVKLLSDVESLHSLNTMLNRTRRRDIQDFCIRRSYTVETSFTEAQSELHNKLLQFEYEALLTLHNVRCIPFMMSMIRRQAASCIFGLAPHIRDIINRRFAQIEYNAELEEEEFTFDSKVSSLLQSMATQVLELAENLPEDDPKFDSIIHIIEEKQKQDNNKIILFSTFRHTLAYLHKKFKELGYRVAQIDGSVKDEERRALRERFELDRNEPEALDLLLFTEVGSEGLDYQFCDTMINYDLPWNPMRIEQRIGRIDRRGQKSEAVNIYNIITADTVDADIYERCLKRIGIFERSIGECEEVLGSIGAQIEKLAIETSLTPEERRAKLEQMADNEVRRMQELAKLEDEERALFGFDLSNYTATKEIKDAESPWLSPLNIQCLIERYLNARLGAGQYIIGSADLKHIRLSKEARLMLLEDYRALSNVRSGYKRKWELYLKGTEPMHKITFVSEVASKERKAFFITPMHPLVKQAAKYFAQDKPRYLHLELYSEDYPAGKYPFSIFAWSYVGINPMFKVVPICSNLSIESDLVELLQTASTTTAPVTVDKSMWDVLEGRHITLWKKEKAKHIESVQTIADFRIESIGSNYRSRKRSLEQKIMDAFEEKIIRMYQSELQTATERYEGKVAEINARVSRADIHTTLVANGIIEIKRG